MPAHMLNLLHLDLCMSSWRKNWDRALRLIPFAQGQARAKTQARYSWSSVSSNVLVKGGRLVAAGDSCLQVPQTPRHLQIFRASNSDVESATAGSGRPSHAAIELWQIRVDLQTGWQSNLQNDPMAVSFKFGSLDLHILVAHRAYTSTRSRP